MAHASSELLTRLLRDVSRSFYLTLRVLPARIRAPIGLAYLLARTTDTIADTGLISLEQRLESLRRLQQRIAGPGSEPLNFNGLAEQQASPAEALLLQQTEGGLALLAEMAPGDQQLIREVLAIITSGQELDLVRFAASSRDHITALQTDQELDDYTYRVAGCVGLFWTRLCRAHLFPQARLDMETLLGNAVRFGKGLQLVNILRDIPADVGQGRCYLPRPGLESCGLQPADLLDPRAEPKFRRVYSLWLERAQGHLEAGWTYTNALPHSCMRVRLACAWPLLIGTRTLKLLRTSNVLEPNRRVKVPRAEVRRLIARTVLWYPWPGRWKRLFADA